VLICHVPQYERLADTFRDLYAKGSSIQTMAPAHGMPWQQAKEILHFAVKGERPVWEGPRAGGGQKQVPPTYRRIAADVARLRDGERMSFPKIVKALAVGEGTVRRAYDHVHQAEIQSAAATGGPPKRGRYSHLSAKTYTRIESLLRRNAGVDRVALATGMSRSTVCRVKHKMQSVAR
jgi:hypothetical protein